MFWTYILYSPSSGKYYIGSTSDVMGRLSAHNHPANKGYTKRFQPWEIAYKKSYDTKEEALSSEKRLKSYKSKILLKKIIENQ